MIDFHCHILPGLDDGAQSLDESLALARQCVDAGVDTVVATPHGHGTIIDTLLPCRSEALQTLSEALAKEQIPLRIYPGLEYFADGHSVDMAVAHPEILCGVPGTPNRPLLLELSIDMDLHFVADLLFMAQLKGVPLVLAHPERYKNFRKSFQLLCDLMDKGLVLQFNSEDFRKSFFHHAIPNLMLALIDHDPTRVVIGSDAHNSVRRPAGLAVAQETITKSLGVMTWEQVSLKNAVELLGI
ncbi:MAG: hypothetical protein J5654_07565 [Victivallales bacterium]|nr:hypothetical protein [Victivallales bacterium]